MNYEKLDNDQKELVKYWIEKYSDESILPFATNECDNFIEKHLTPEPVIEVGFWYKHPNGRHPNWLAYNDGGDGYGFGTNGSWLDGYDGIVRYLHQIKAEKATRQEVEQRLIEEAKRRGFVEGAKYDCVLSEATNLNFTDAFNGHVNKWQYDHKNQTLSKECNQYIFNKGKWAEIIDDKSEVIDEILGFIARIETELEGLKSKL